MSPIEVSEVTMEAAKLFSKIGAPFLLITILFTIIPVMVSTMSNLMGGGGSRSYSESKQEFKLNFKDVDIKTRTYNKISYAFFIKSIDKQSFIKSLFTRWSSSTIKIGKNVYKKGYKAYEFTTDKEIYIKITNEIHKPITTIKDETLLIQFNEAIHYSIKQLEQLSKQGGIVDLQQEVDRVINLVKEIKAFTDHIDNEAQAETEKLRVTSMNEILQKHHTVMEQLTLGVKMFNTNNQVVTDLKNNKSSEPAISLDKGNPISRNKSDNNIYE